MLQDAQLQTNKMQTTRPMTPTVPPANEFRKRTCLHIQLQGCEDVDHNLTFFVFACYINVSPTHGQCARLHHVTTPGVHAHNASLLVGAPGLLDAIGTDGNKLL